jgi:hypothetical protein
MGPGPFLRTVDGPVPAPTGIAPERGEVQQIDRRDAGLGMTERRLLALLRGPKRPRPASAPAPRPAPRRPDEPLSP